MNKEETPKTNIKENDSFMEKASVLNSFDMSMNMFQTDTKIKGVKKDLIKAYLPEAQREYYEETLENAHLAQMLMDKYHQDGYSYKWDNKKMCWEKNEDNSFKKFPLKEEEIKKLKEYSENTFQFLMIKALAICLTHRNRKENPLVYKVLKSGDEEENKGAVEQQDPKSMFQKIMGKLQGEQVYEED